MVRAQTLTGTPLAVPISSNIPAYSGTTVNWGAGNYQVSSANAQSNIVLTAPSMSGSYNFSSWTGCTSTSASNRTCTITSLPLGLAVQVAANYLMCASGETYCSATGSCIPSSATCGAVSTYDGSGIIEKFDTQPSSRIVNKGQNCVIDWQLKQSAINTLTNLSCVVNPGATSINITTTSGIFTKTNLQTTTEYRLNCSGLDNLGTLISETKINRCLVNPTIQEL